MSGSWWGIKYLTSIRYNASSRGRKREQTSFSVTGTSAKPTCWKVRHLDGKRMRGKVVLLILLPIVILLPICRACYLIDEEEVQRNVYRPSETYRGICNARGRKCHYVCRSEDSAGGRCAYFPDTLGFPWDCMCVCYNNRNNNYNIFN